MKRIFSYRLTLVRESSNLYETNLVHNPEDVANIARKFRGDDIDREFFTVMLCDIKGRIIGIQDVSCGSLTASVVHPREVFKVAMLANAASVILVHNHPSGDPTPSREDIVTTQRLVEIGKLMDIPVLDHIILGLSPLGFEWISFEERNLINHSLAF